MPSVTNERQSVADYAALAARSAKDRAPSGSADVQRPQHVEFVTSTPSYLDPSTKA